MSNIGLHCVSLSKKRSLVIVIVNDMQLPLRLMVLFYRMAEMSSLAESVHCIRSEVSGEQTRRPQLPLFLQCSHHTSAQASNHLLFFDTFDIQVLLQPSWLSSDNVHHVLISFPGFFDLER